MLERTRRLPPAPHAERRPKSSLWHGTTLTDDYAWLRADNWREVMREPSVLDLKIRDYLEAENAYTKATLAHTDTFNPQEQMRVTWPATAVVGRAYLDQLARSRSLPADRISTIRAALDKAENLSGRSSQAADAAGQLETLASQIESSAAAARSTDKTRLGALASLLTTRAAALRQ